MNYEEAVKYISDIPKFTKKNSLEHTKKFLLELNIDVNKMKVIHVAGTNGKGSVCAIISNVLVECKKRTGLFVSPHLVEMNERIRINNEQIDNEEFTNAFNRVKYAADRMCERGYSHPTFFEFLLLMGMWEFNKENVEYAVLETGLGGRLDATNSIDNPYLTIITSIGMDHMEYLGDTIDKIAGEKAGIIKTGVPVIYWGQDEKVSGVIEEKGRLCNSKLIKVCKNNYKINKKTNKSVDFSILNGYYLNDTFSIPFISEYQVQNAAVALKAIECMKDIRDYLEYVKNGIAGVKWEGRMEIVRTGVIFDGAHNGPGIDEFIKTFNEYTCSGRKLILFSVVKDKDYDYMVSKLSATEAAMVFVTHIDSERGLETEKISRDFNENSCKAAIVIKENVKDAFECELKKKGEKDVLFCVGSLYLVGELKKCIKEVK